MHPSHHARTDPEKIACIVESSGETLSYGQLERRSNQIARLFQLRGIGPGDAIAIMMENRLELLEVAWAAQRSGLYFVCVSSRLTADETLYILRDSAAKALVTSFNLAEIVAPIAAQIEGLVLLMCGGTIQPFESLEESTSILAETPIEAEAAGTDLLYSSGTTGKPKGIKNPLPEGPFDAPDSVVRMASGIYGMSASTVYLSPAPLYHAAPLRWTMAVHRLGGTVIVMEKFDAEETLALIERHRVTHAQFVPTHFVRLLRLPDETKRRYDRSTLRVALHAAAPCAVPIKRAMIDWWGPIIWEYYGGSEGNGVTMIRSEEWLTHPGSVGRAILGVLHICDDNGDELSAGTIGGVYFSGGAPINYHNDPDKTAAAYNKHGWSTIGDIGWADEEGYLYLTDRASFTIITGGVNVYPQEIENVFITHPKVADVAVFGIPDEDFGERVVAVVQPTEATIDEEALRSELIGFARETLSGIKIPRQIDFLADLPRHPTGKLYKRLLKDQYTARAVASAHV